MTVLEKAGKAHKRTEHSKPGASIATQALPGPPEAPSAQANGSKYSDKDETGSKAAMPAANREKTMQHERRGENALLKEAVDYARGLQASKVRICP